MHRANEEPPGKIEAIGGVKCYVATPTGEYARDTVVLFLPDVFGLEFVNSQVRALLLLVGLGPNMRSSLRTGSLRTGSGPSSPTT
jgi:uncharacterized membrane protein YczE